MVTVNLNFCDIFPGLRPKTLCKLSAAEYQENFINLYTDDVLMCPVTLVIALFTCITFIRYGAYNKFDKFMNETNRWPVKKLCFYRLAVWCPAYHMCVHGTSDPCVSVRVHKYCGLFMHQCKSTTHRSAGHIMVHVQSCYHYCFFVEIIYDRMFNDVILHRMKDQRLISRLSRMDKSYAEAEEHCSSMLYIYMHARWVWPRKAAAEMFEKSHSQLILCRFLWFEKGTNRSFNLYNNVWTYNEPIHTKGLKNNTPGKRIWSLPASSITLLIGLSLIIIIIIIIKICSAHISTLLGAQGAETEKTWIQTIYSDTTVAKTKLWDTCTMQLQIYIIFEKLWHKMSFKQRLKSSYTMTRFDFSWKMIPESRSRDRKRPITPGPFWSWFL